MFFGTISIIFRDPGQTLKIRDCPGRFGTVGAYGCDDRELVFYVYICC